MAQAQECKERLKFKRFLVNEGPLMPQGYRLATVEEIRTNLDMFKKSELPVKRISPSYEERSGDIRLLDGWVPADFKVVNEAPNYNCIWNAVVKTKRWDSTENKWQNCSDFYSSDGFSLRKQLYNEIKLSPQGREAAWLHAYCYEDVEMLYWLWETYPHSIASDNFTTECRPQHIFMDINHHIPLREMVRRLEDRGTKSQLEIANAGEEARAVLRYAMDRSRDRAGFIYLYGPTWGVATVELAIEIYGQDFKNTAARIVFENAENVPITTKFLSLLVQDEPEKQIPKPEFPVAEVLIEAVKRGYSRLITDIMTKGDSITHITGDEYLRALTEAVGGGYEELVKRLLSCKVAKQLRLPHQVDNEGKTLFYYALPHEQVFFSLKEKYGRSFDEIITRTDICRRNVLHWAAKRGCDARIVDCLLQCSRSVKERLIYSKDQKRRTPWHIAASKGNIVMIRKLGEDLNNADFKKKIDYIQATDFFGQTALQMAAIEGHDEAVKILLNVGACPLKERDGQGKTVLHYAAKVKIPRAALATCKALLEPDDPTSSNSSKRSLLLWASATGIGTADEMEDVHDIVKNYLQDKKDVYRENLLRAAATNDNIEMAWGLLSRGADIADFRDLDWMDDLEASEKESVKNVLSHMEHIKEQGRDQPSMEDKLGRYVFAQGLAALFLNRFIESPITVGISGEWGMGKSSLMIQTEKILLITAAQLTFPNLLPPKQFVKNISLSTRGRKIYQQINRGVYDLLHLPKNESKKQNPLVALLKEYQPRYHDVYKALACMDNNQMLQLSSASRQQEQDNVFREVPRILTIRYNAWHYRNREEAWAGLGVTISKEIEKAMTSAQWMSTCWRYTWAKQRVNIWIQVFLPSLLSIFLSGSVAWIVWMLLKQAKFHGLKYGSIPLTIIAIVWVVLKSVSSVVKPVSTQMLGYVTVPDHTGHLGYQEDVINDINFLKKELGTQPYRFFSFILWCWNLFGLYGDNVENTSIPKCMPASGHEIRIVTFVDDLDRCEDKVILQVLSAINLVLAECKINVILGMDKKMIERAIGVNYEDEEGDLAEKFISKIIQIPLSLPDPTDQDSNRFLEYHLRHKIPAEFHCTDTEKRSFSISQHCLIEVPLETNGAEANGAPRDPETVLNMPCCELKRRCRGIIERPYDESLHLSGSAEGVRLIREILLPNYTTEEAHLFYKLKSFATGNQKLPREWKRLLSYHKFAWYVLSLIGNVYSLPAWKNELVGWVFVCWQWKHEMNHLVKVWNSIHIEQDNGRNKGDYHGPSLGELVSKCMSHTPNADPSEVNTPNADPSEVNEQVKSQNKWSKLRGALKIQDVSMEGIQLFQQFRLHCEIDHLPWPNGSSAETSL